MNHLINIVEFQVQALSTMTSNGEVRTMGDTIPTLKQFMTLLENEEVEKINK